MSETAVHNSSTKKEKFLVVTLSFFREKQCMKQIESILPRLHALRTHRERQNAVKTSMTLLATLETHFFVLTTLSRPE